MGEIDDLYKQEVEDTDVAFLEELKTTKNRDKSFVKYQNNLNKSREKFIKKYGRFNSSETRRIRKMKKKVDGVGKFKRLKITHFDFEFGFWERLWMGLDVGWFNFVRKIKRFKTWVFPGWLIYEYCKIRDFVWTIWRDFAGYLNVELSGLKNFTIKLGISIWEKLKSLSIWIAGISGKILFWKKGKEVEKKTEEEGENIEKV